MTTGPGTSVREALAAAAGRVRQGADMARYCEEPRGMWRGAPALVVCPADTQGVAACVRICAEAGIGIVPWGGGTGLVAGQIAPEGTVLLSLERLTEARAVSDQTMTLGAGVTLLKAQQIAAEAGRLFPLSLASEGSCTIGGVLSTNAGGVQVLRYGNARDLCLGLEVVTAQGAVWNGLAPLRKNNTGYDLRHLMIGAEGTLGIITAASLRLFPRPKTRAVAFVGLEDPEAALGLLARCQQASEGLSVFELMPRFGLELVCAQGGRDPLAAAHPWYALIEFWGGPEQEELLGATIMAALEAGQARDAALAQNETQALALRALREEMSAAQKAEGGSIKHDISLPLDAIPDFIAEAGAAITRAIPGARPCPFGHLGDGNLHYNISQPQGAEEAGFLARWEEVNRITHDLVTQRGGAISAEHGIGRIKRAELAHYADPVKLGMLRAIKTALDPAGILNPGAVLTEDRQWK